MTTQNQNWTAEPWLVVAEGPWILDKHGETILITRPLPESPANTKRVCDCVNACAGMPDPAAEIASMREMVEQARAILKTRIIEPLGYGSNVLRP